MEVLRTGQQTLVLGTQGEAIGGSFTISPRLSQEISSLVIPQGVTAIDNVGRSGTLTLTGNLTDAGNLYIVSSNPQITTATISAANINILQGGVLSSVLPTTGLSGITNAVPNLSLTLIASNNITNAGGITSSGNLSLSAGSNITNSGAVTSAGNLSLNAGGNIVNSGAITSAGNLSALAGGTITNAVPSGTSAPPPVMVALNDVSLQAQSVLNQGTIASQLGNLDVTTNSLTNSGTIQAQAGNLTIQNLSGNSLSIDNTGGTLQAAATLSISSAADNQTSTLLNPDLTINGGFLEGDQGIALVSAGDLSLYMDIS